MGAADRYRPAKRKDLKLEPSDACSGAEGTPTALSAIAARHLKRQAFAGKKARAAQVFSTGVCVSACYARACRIFQRA